MMVAVDGLVKREREWVSAVRRRFGRLLSPAVLSVFVLAAIAAAPAAADEIGAVVINGQGALPCEGAGTHTGNWCVGTAPLVTVTLGHHAGSADERLLIVRNDETDGSDAITQLTLSLDPKSSNPFNFGAYWIGPADPTDDTTFRCLGERDTFEMRCPFAAGAFDDGGVKIPVAGAGRGHSFDLEYSRERPESGLDTLRVEFNYGNAISPCAGPAAPTFSGQARDTARVADACTPPSHTRITEAKINRNTAFFRFTGQHATSFECVLLRNKKVMFRRSCRSPKPYANPLPHGKYVFVVTGLNHAGIDRKAATKKFTIK
jgi:hypothetical protein